MRIYHHKGFDQKVLQIGNLHFLPQVERFWFALSVIKVGTVNADVKAKFFMNFGFRYGLPLNKFSREKELNFFHTLKVGNAVTI